MGEKFLVQGGNKKKICQLSLGKDTMYGQSSMTVDIERIKTIGNSLGIDWNSINATELYEGTQVEAEEHPDVMNGSLEVAVRIAYAHLKEIPDYYTRLEAMEAQAGADRVPNTDKNIQNA